MSILCLPSHHSTDVRCTVCGQGFAIFAEQPTATVREQVKRRVQKAMRRHHAAGAPGSLDVHPAGAFNVEEENSGIGDWLSGWLPLGNPAAALAY